MKVLFLSLALLFIVALVAGWVRNRLLQRKLQRGEISELPGIKRSRPDGCCGKHAVCEKEILMQAAVTNDIVYYDDEELDVYHGRAADSYTPAEVEQFEDVLTTMLAADVPGWLQSLERRGINLPNELRDEVLMILG